MTLTSRARVAVDVDRSRALVELDAAAANDLITMGLDIPTPTARRLRIASIPGI